MVKTKVSESALLVDLAKAMSKFKSKAENTLKLGDFASYSKTASVLRDTINSQKIGVPFTHISSAEVKELIGISSIAISLEKSDPSTPSIVIKWQVEAKIISTLDNPSGFIIYMALH